MNRLVFVFVFQSSFWSHSFFLGLMGDVGYLEMCIWLSETEEAWFAVDACCDVTKKWEQRILAGFHFCYWLPSCVCSTHRVTSAGRSLWLKALHIAAHLVAGKR